MRRAVANEKAPTRAETPQPRILTLEHFPDPDLARTLSPNGRVHYRPKNAAKVTVARLVTLAARMAGLPKFSRPVRITFRWIFPREGRHDIDNLIGSGVCKAAIDALVEGKWLLDDDRRWVTAVAAEVEVIRGRRALEIEIREDNRE